MTNQTEITLTDNAKLHIEKVLEKESGGLGLRLAVKTTGCSGNQYVIETAKSINEAAYTCHFAILIEFKKALSSNINTCFAPILVFKYPYSVI